MRATLSWSSLEPAPTAKGGFGVLLPEHVALGRHLFFSARSASFRTSVLSEYGTLSCPLLLWMPDIAEPRTTALAVEPLGCARFFRLLYPQDDNSDVHRWGCFFATCALGEPGTVSVAIGGLWKNPAVTGPVNHQ